MLPVSQRWWKVMPMAVINATIEEFYFGEAWEGYTTWITPAQR